MSRNSHLTAVSEVAPCDLSVIIVSWNTRDLLADCLRSIPAGVGALSTEIIVVDNASTDGTATMVRGHFPEVTLIESGANLGFAAGNNLALRQAIGRCILLLNPDTLVAPGALVALVAFLNTHPNFGIVGPLLVDGSGHVQPSWADFPTLRSELLVGHRRHRKPLPGGDAYEVDWIAGACMAVRPEAIKTVGLMDERFFLYTEETDWCLRFHQAGWRVAFFPEVRVVHLEGSSTVKDAPRASFLLYHSKMLYFDKHYGRAMAQVLRLSMVALAPLRAAWSLIKGRPRSARRHLSVAHQLLHADFRRATHG